MEIKDNKLIIDIPKGMEIDTENSNLAEGIIKFKPKCIPYEGNEHLLGTTKDVED